MLPDDIRQPERVIFDRAKRILRQTVTGDYRSGLPQVLGRSPFAVDEVGEWSVSDKPGHGRPVRLIGATLIVRLERPHPVNAIVVAAGTRWPRGSQNYRFSRRYGYVPYRARLTSERLTDLEALVDVRRGKVASVDSGPGGSGRSDPLAGACPSKPPPGGYD